jgi:hypothetical protein
MGKGHPNCHVPRGKSRERIAGPFQAALTQKKTKISLTGHVSRENSIEKIKPDVGQSVDYSGQPF